MAAIIKVRGLGKSYFITHEASERYSTLRDRINNSARKVFSFSSAPKNIESQAREEFWALSDINFEINKGDRLAIIGRNGAGKSTLLKILSRITEPSKGEIMMKGRVASLLEVGTGFHPELSGRENIFLNGAILGMGRQEIRKKFDEIVAFAEIEKFIDTPVKRYSSGMYVRLAFAVAAHLDPEILVIDEVLAVGDAQFQKKCLGKMQDVSVSEGRTVLFVSHNMPAVKTLCNRGIVLQGGRVTADSSIDEAVSEYLKGGVLTQGHRVFTDVHNNDVSITEISVKAEGKTAADPITLKDSIRIQAKLYIEDHESQYRITYHLGNESGETLFSFWDETGEARFRKGDNSLSCIIPSHFLNTGTFYLSVLLVKDKREAILVEKDAVSFVVSDDEKELGSWMGREPGYIRPAFKWENTD